MRRIGRNSWFKSPEWAPIGTPVIEYTFRIKLRHLKCSSIRSRGLWTKGWFSFFEFALIYRRVSQSTLGTHYHPSWGRLKTSNFPSNLDECVMVSFRLLLEPQTWQFFPSVSYTLAVDEVSFILKTKKIFREIPSTGCIHNVWCTVCIRYAISEVFKCIKFSPNLAISQHTNPSICSNSLLSGASIQWIVFQVLIDAVSLSIRFIHQIYAIDHLIAQPVALDSRHCTGAHCMSRTGPECCCII